MSVSRHYSRWVSCHVRLVLCLSSVVWVYCDVSVLWCQSLVMSFSCACSMPFSHMWRASHMWRDSFMCLFFSFVFSWWARLAQVWVYCAFVMAHAYVWHDSFIRVTWLVPLCTRLMCHGSCICVTWLIHIVRLSCACHASCLYVTWLIHMCQMPHSYLCVTWLIHMCQIHHSCPWCPDGQDCRHFE